MHTNDVLNDSFLHKARTHKNGRLEQEHVTPIEVCSPGEIIELF